MSGVDLLALAARVEAGVGFDNALDVLIDVAMFLPDDTFCEARPNFACTKVVYTTHAGPTVSHWAWDWTLDRPAAARALRARHQSAAGEGKNDA